MELLHYIYFLVTSVQATSLTTLEDVKDNEGSENENEVYIDPDIYNPKRKLSVLYESLPYIENEDVYKLVEEIIKVME